MKTDYEFITLETPEVREWMKGGKILASKDDERRGRFYVAAEFEGGKYNNSELRLYRFFTIGDTVHCSLDGKAQNLADFMQLALDCLIDA